MGKHTPGPWHWDGRQAGYGSLVSESGAEVLADIDYEGLNLHGDDKEADACLIAASPDLLEACRKLVEAEDANSPLDRNMMKDDAVILARAAIAKAEGGA
jgi:hypothetical protein